MKNYSRFSMILIVCPVMISFLTSCTGGDVTTNSDASGSSGLSISISKIQNLSQPQWVVDSSGKIYTSLATLTIEGICSRGIASISATLNGTLATETAACNTDGSFLWTKNLSATTPAIGTPYDVVFQALQINSLPLSGVTASTGIVVDTQAPTAPVLDPVAGCSLNVGTWICSSSSVQISGSWAGSEDVMSLQFPASGLTTYPTSTSFAFNLTLSEGQSRTLSFTVKDRAGNISGSSSIAVTYSPATQALASDVSGGGTIGFAGGPVGGNPSMIGSISPFGGRTYDLNSALPNNQRVQLQLGTVATGAQQINP